jgi:hypothetical protein
MMTLPNTQNIAKGQYRVSYPLYLEKKQLSIFHQESAAAT